MKPTDRSIDEDESDEAFLAALAQATHDVLRDLWDNDEDTVWDDAGPET